MKPSKSSKFRFDDDQNKIVFEYGTGRTQYLEILTYEPYLYKSAKELFMSFLSEPDLREKISKFGHALNFPCADESLHKLAFGIEVMFRYDWNKTIDALQFKNKEGQTT